MMRLVVGLMTIFVAILGVRLLLERIYYDVVVVVVVVDVGFVMSFLSALGCMTAYPLCCF